MPIVVSDIHFQKTTSSALTCDLTFCFVSRLKICNVRPARYGEFVRFRYRQGTRTLQREDLLARVHNCAVRCDGSPEDIVGIHEVDNNNLVLLSNLLSYTDEVVGLESEGLRVTHLVSSSARPVRPTHLEGDGGRLNTYCRQLEVLAEGDGLRDIHDWRGFCGHVAPVVSCVVRSGGGSKARGFGTVYPRPITGNCCVPRVHASGRL